MANRKCSRNISFRVTEEEWKRFDELTRIIGKPKGTILRQLIEGFVYQPCPTSEALQYIKQLRYIGNNLNQIARVAQRTGNIDTPFLKELYRQQVEIIDSVENLLFTPITFDIKRIMRSDSQNDE